MEKFLTVKEDGHLEHAVILIGSRSNPTKTDMSPENQSLEVGRYIFLLK